MSGSSGLTQVRGIVAVDSSGGGGGGNGTVVSAGAFQAAYYPSAGDTITGNPNIIYTSGGDARFGGVVSAVSFAGVAGSLSGDLDFGGQVRGPSALITTISASTVNSTAILTGDVGTATGSVTFNGTTSGVFTETVNDAAGTWTLKWPSSAGAGGMMLTTDGTGVTTWTSAGGGSGSGTVVSAGPLQATYYPAGGTSVTGNPNITFTSAGAASFAANISAASLNLTGAISAASTSLTGALTAATGTFTGAVSAASMHANAIISAGTDVNAAANLVAGARTVVASGDTGRLNATLGSFSSTVSAGAVNVAGAVSAASVALTGNITAAGGSFSATVSSNAINTVNVSADHVYASAATFAAAVTANSLHINTVVSAGTDVNAAANLVAGARTVVCSGDSGTLNATTVVAGTVVGGAAASSTLTLKSTSGVGTTDSISLVTGNNGANTAISLNTLGYPRYNASTKIVGSNQTVTNSSSLTAITDLLATVENGKKYRLDYRLKATSQTGGMRFDMNGGTAVLSLFEISGYGLFQNDGTSYGFGPINSRTTIFWFESGATNGDTVFPSAIITVTSGGTFGPRVAQVSATVGNSVVVSADSMMSLVQLN